VAVLRPRSRIVTASLLRGWPLAATAALTAGAGKLSVATVRSVAGHVAATVPEARVVSLAQMARGEIAPSAAARRVAPLGFLARELLAEVPRLLRQHEGRRP
jgi:NAD(P)H-hydrate repair Nnr-like enzyme with NAD(P)H-hydrate dehydratase domain